MKRSEVAEVEKAQGGVEDAEPVTADKLEAMVAGGQCRGP